MFEKWYEATTAMSRGGASCRGEFLKKEISSLCDILHDLSMLSSPLLTNRYEVITNQFSSVKQFEHRLH